jgi:hypothetical protein
MLVSDLWNISRIDTAYRAETVGCVLLGFCALICPKCIELVARPHFPREIHLSLDVAIKRATILSPILIADSPTRRFWRRMRIRRALLGSRPSEAIRRSRARYSAVWRVRAIGDRGVDCSITHQSIVQNDKEACAKTRRAAEPVLNAPPASDVERLKYGVPSTPTGVP